jgi:hypothetical protein
LETTIQIQNQQALSVETARKLTNEIALFTGRILTETANQKSFQDRMADLESETLRLTKYKNELVTLASSKRSNTSFIKQAQHELALLQQQEQSLKEGIGIVVVNYLVFSTFGQSPRDM